MAVAKEPVYYWSYLHLDELLSAQEPLSDPAAHDELLFIVVHQAFELWFKQILFELDAVLDVMGQEVVAEKDMGEVVARLARITKVQRLLTDQIEVLETMTPLDFLEFRDVLIPASGFQSVQFRLIENKLGLDTRPPAEDQGDALHQRPVRGACRRHRGVGAGAVAPRPPRAVAAPHPVPLVRRASTSGRPTGRRWGR